MKIAQTSVVERRSSSETYIYVGTGRIDCGVGSLTDRSYKRAALTSAANAAAGTADLSLT